ncbi:MAG: Rieske 2Fe-2S domain-containing protein [Actinomycetota bacterium]|nr:Rieske 2Fe-2S domain-containing protein [Actinomycetota bacterium]
MVTAEENRLLTQSGPGTPGGSVLRRYWQPAALTEELDGDRPLVPVTLLGEELVLFRNEESELGLIGRSCPHRGVDLCFGRLEDGGLRCPFHGWLFDATGACLETPAEPAGSTFCQRVKHVGYPVVERNGIVWAYLGDGSPPPLPTFDCFAAPPTHVFSFKGLWQCNWLQSHEVGIDPAHAQFLHRFLQDDTQEYGRQFRDLVADTGVPMTKLMREASPPTITAEDTDFGFRLRSTRDFRGQLTHVRVSNCIFPNAITIAMSRSMSITQWHVPVDDVSSYWYAMFVSFDGPVDADVMRNQRITQVELPGYRPTTGIASQWGYDAEEQRTETYTGMGRDINVHDQWAVESQGPIFDRTKEQLSPADIGIRTHRRMFLAALGDAAASSAPLPGQGQPFHGPIAIDAVTDHPPGEPGFDDACDHAWRELDRSRRLASTWATPLS